MSTFSYYSNRFVRTVLWLLFLVLVVGLSRNAYQLWRLGDRVSETDAKVRVLAEEKERLEKEYEQNTSDFAIEREIRNKLQLVLPGETAVIIPKNQGEERTGPMVEEPQPVVDERPNWQKWWGVVRGEDLN